MTTYKEIFGKPVKQVSSDPTDSGAEGQIWFNTTAGVFKSVVASGAWASDSSLVTARQSTSAAGTMSAMFAAGGGYDPAVATNENYNGSGWSSAEALPAARAGGGQAFGTQTAGVYFGGTSADPATRHTDSYEYDGTNWTGGGAYPTAVTNLGSSGTLTAGLGFGGDPGSLATTAEYNGTAWTAGGSLNTGREGVAFSSAGTQTASLCAGGYNNPPGPRTNVEAYNGTAWTEVNDIPTGRSSTTGAGTETNTIVIGGEISTGITNTCVQYDGTNWAAIPSMATPRFQTGTAGPGAGALAISGWGPGLRPTNEQYNFTANTITAGAWASGGSLNTKHNGASASGTQTAALVSGGNDGLAPNYSTVNSEEYNGTAWTEGNNRSVSVYNTMGSGSQTAGLAFGGNKYTAGISNATEEYDGTSWTGGGTLNTATDAGIGFGLQTASVKAGGYGSPGASTNSSEEYDGSSWTAGNNINTARSEQPGGFGILTAGVMFGGGGSGTPGTVATTVEEYNGTNWSTVNSTNLGHSGAWACGTQTDGIGGGGGPTTTSAEVYNGTNWVTTASLSTGRSFANGLGTPSTASSALVSAGEPSRVVTEEFTGETTTLNVKTLTSS